METDYVIVGAGSAGSVLANRLTENPNHQVTILEAGPKDYSWKIHMPAALMYNLGRCVCVCVCVCECVCVKERERNRQSLCWRESLCVK